MTFCETCQHFHQTIRKCGFPVWTTMPHHQLAGNIPCECKHTNEVRTGFIFNLTSAWIGIHYSKRERRVCINILPCLTFWITRKGGTLP